MNNSFITKTEKYADSYGMLCGIKSVLAAFSGGADSTSMLIALNTICRKRGIMLYAAHVNHGIRGDESDRDEDFCRALCERLSIEFFCEKIDIPALCAQSGMGCEECARKERYAFFDRLCLEHNIDRIATAHNIEDNAETVIFHLCRGSSLAGLCGIAPVRDNIIRPILSSSKSECIAFLNDCNQSYVTDSTNNTDDYTRNYIRHNIIPSLQNVNIQAVKNIFNMCSIVSEDRKIVEHVVDSDKNYEYRRLSRNYTDKYHTVLEKCHNDSIRKLVESGKNGQSVSLPGNIRLVKRDGGYCFEKDTERIYGSSAGIKNNEVSTFVKYVNIDNGCCKCVIPNCGKVTFTNNELSELNEKDINKNINIYKKSTLYYAKSVKIIGKLFIRFRQNGDKIRCGKCVKSIKKLFCEKKVPISERGRLPFICDDDGIVWIPGVALRDGSYCSEGKLTMLFERENE